MSAPFQKRDLLPRRLVALRDWHPTWSPDPAIPEEDQIADAEEDEEKEHFERHRLLGLQNVLAGQLRSEYVCHRTLPSSPLAFFPLVWAVFDTYGAPVNRHRRSVCRRTG
jgi:hypothetical protein